MAGLTPDDLIRASAFVADVLAPAVADDWTVPAGPLEWDCRRTLDHLPDTLLLYAGHLACRAERGLPYVRHGEPGISPRRLLGVMTTAAHILAAVARAAPPGTVAFHPAGFADAEGFCAMGCDELLVHGADIAAGLDLVFTPAVDLVASVVARLFPLAPEGGDPWATLLWANGRAALPGHDRLAPDWVWQAAPITAQDAAPIAAHDAARVAAQDAAPITAHDAAPVAAPR